MPTLAIHPDALSHREQICRTGFGYHEAMDFLVVMPRGKHNPMLIELRRSQWCPCTALELLWHPYTDVLVGVKYVSPAVLLGLFAEELPEVCPTSFFQSLSERYYGRPNADLRLTAGGREKVAALHRLAKGFADSVSDPLPPDIVQRIRLRRSRCHPCA